MGSSGEKDGDLQPVKGSAKSGGSGASADDPWRIEPMLSALLDAPLDFIFTDHARQRQASMILTRVASGEFDRTGVAALVEFLEGDFSLHVGDEELGFFPVLREKCAPEDKVDKILARLAAEHKEDEAICDEVVSLLKGLLTGKKLKPGDAEQMSAFAEHIRQHLAFENSVLLPLARVRMDADSLLALSKILKERRAH